jgi:type I restriction enzyme M protein
MNDAHLADLEEWWGGVERSGRATTPHAWRVPVKSLNDEVDLDLRNPHQKDELAHRDPSELIADLIESEQELLKLLQQLQREFKGSQQ